MTADTMNAERLLALYDRVADAPDSIPRLRRFVLDLAVRGQLVEQYSYDESASALLQQIESEKARLAAAGHIKNPKRSAPLESDEMEFTIPPGWKWVRLSDVAICLDYKRKPINSMEREKRIEGKKEEELYPYFGATKQHGWIDDYIFDEELLLLGEDGVPFFDPFRPKAYIISGKTWVNNHAHVLKGILISHSFLAHYLNVFDYSGRVVGATRSKLNQARALDIPVSLPPLAEQQRIVKKVEELMALLDRLEETHTSAETARDRLTTASLARLSAPDTTPDAFTEHARFALDTFSALTTRADQVRAFRETILNLAVRGYLVEQNSEDEPAKRLLERIAGERKRIVTKRRIRGSKPPNAPSDENADYPLPPTWELCSLGQITLIMDPNPSHRYPEYSSGVVPILSTREFSGEYGWNPATAKLTTEAFWEFQNEICDFSEGDIVFARKGRLGLPRFLPHLERFTFSHTLFVIKPIHGLDPSYLLLLLRRQEVVDWLTNEMNQNTGVPTLGKGKTERLPVPLPPHAEQRRIVDKVDKLMALCNRLEEALRTSGCAKQRLLEALLGDALEEDTHNREAA